MSDRPRKLECEAFLEALEATSPEKGTEALPGVLLGLMNEPKRGHAEVCADCRAAEEARQAEMRPVESLFETTASTPLNDDVLAVSHQEPHP